MRLFSVYRGLYCILPSNIGFTRIRFSTKQYFMESIRVFLMFFFFSRLTNLRNFSPNKNPSKDWHGQKLQPTWFWLHHVSGGKPGKISCFSVFGAGSSHGDICHQKWSSHFASVQRTLIKGLSSRQLTLFFVCLLWLWSVV